MNHKQRMKIWRLKDHIKTPVDVANYLEAAVSEGDYDFLKIAVKDVISILHTKIQTDFTLLNWYYNKYNELQMKAEPEKCEPTDPYAKYRKWAGKLCRFWNIDKDRAIYDILEEVIADWSYQFKTKGDYIFDHCEPVKPDDDIIYKGE